LAGQGYVVEKYAQKLFPEGVFTKQFTDDAASIIHKYVDRQSTVLFQTTFSFDVFLARTDVLEYNSQTNEWYLYEIKSTSSIDENAKKIDHIEDASFQSIILKEQGIKLLRFFSCTSTRNTS
jgi:hypothetical protein